MAWKYIMFAAKGPTGVIHRFPVIFPDAMVHSRVFGQLRHVMGHDPYLVAESAGKIDHVEVEGLGGDSETLGIASMPEDEEVIETFEHTHGLVK